MGALSKTLPYSLGALVVEAKAIEIGICFSWELGLREIILEGDSQIVMNAIANHDPGPIQIQQLVTGIKSWVPKFSAWKTSFTRREGTRQLTSWLNMPNRFLNVPFGWKILPL